MPDGKKILIAEDEKPMANALKAKLEHEGFSVTAVHDGKAALAEMASQQFDLLVLDLVMPTADGWHVLETLKAQNTTLPIIVATNLSQEEDEKRARELGAKDFVVKSNVPIADLAERIKALL